MIPRLSKGLLRRGSDDFEIDFDEEPTAATSAEVVDDFTLDFDEEEPAPEIPVELSPAVTTPPPVPIKKAPASLADSTKPAPAKKEPELPTSNENSTVADDAVADFLLGLKIDDDD